MKTPEYILSFDPSGSYYEGKGVTGWCLFNKKEMKITEASIIPSTDYHNAMEYYEAHLTVLERLFNLSGIGYDVDVVIEDYLLYATKAKAQINSRMETCQLIGILKHACWEHKITPEMQPASLVMDRWSNKILVRKGYIVPKGRGFCLPGFDYYLSNHSIDAIRHAVHFATFYERKKK